MTYKSILSKLQGLLGVFFLPAALETLILKAMLDANTLR